MKVVYTGTRNVPSVEKADLVRDDVRSLPYGTVVIVGGAQGVDTIVEHEMIRLGLGKFVYLVIPAQGTWATYSGEWLAMLGGYERMPPGTSYIDRDRRMVEIGDALRAFPLYPEWDHKTKTGDPRSMRSGTWATIRRARALGREIQRLEVLGL